MATSIAAELTPDRVMTLELLPGTLEQFRATLEEGGPLLKCYEGSVTFVSPGETHETYSQRLGILLLAVCGVFKVPLRPLGSTYWHVSGGAKNVGYEPDGCYYIRDPATIEKGQIPDLAIEIVVSHSPKKALACGAALGIPELWVLDIPAHRLTFHHLVRRGKSAGTYKPMPNSRAFPWLPSAELLEQLDDPEQDGPGFLENCREWATQILLPKAQR